MKKIALTIAILLGITMGASAQDNGLFGKGPNPWSENYFYNYNNRTEGEGLLGLPSAHGGTTDEPAPIGSGALLLIGFGAAYALSKKNKK